MAAQEIAHWIDGEADAGSGAGRQAVYNPATGEEAGSLALADPADADRAVAAARRAFDSWSNTPLSKRISVLFSFREKVKAHTDELARVITAEHGKTLPDAAGEVARGLEVIEYACALPETLKGDYSEQVSSGIDVFSFRQPLGVVAAITPFNFPVMVPLWMSPIAIATGNAVVLKPSERDPSASLLLAKLWQEAGLPDAVFNVVNGGRDVVERLLEHDDVDAVSFVGSTPVARSIYEKASSRGKRVQALGGAKNHAVVLPDSDLDLAADHLAAAAFGSAGERCMAVSVAVAVGDVGDELVEKLKERAADVIVGDGAEDGTGMGPLITPEAKERVESIVAGAEAEGAVLAVDGRGLVVEGREGGFFTGPSVLDHVSTDAEAYKQEIFGPVLAVVRVKDLDEAIEVINNNPYGNGTAIFTGSGAAAREFQRRVTVGMIGVNVPIPVPAAQHSFGGWKDSLFGEHHIYGPDGVAFYTRGKVVTQRWPKENDPVEASLNFPTN